MKKFLENNIKKITILLGIIMVVIIAVFVFKGKKVATSLKNYENKVYSISYDNTWKITKNEEDKIVFKNDNSTLDIDIIQLSDNKRYEKINTMIDDIITSLNNQNKDYNLIGKESTKLTSKNLDGYKLLYETKDKQVLVNVVKVTDKLIIFRYEASNDYFDILLDSAQNIIYNFELKKYQTEYELVKEITNEKISYGSKDKFEKTKNGKISNQHYIVEYTIPKEFNLLYFNSFQETYEYQNDSNDIKIDTSVLAYNIYEFCESNESNSISKKVENYKKMDKVSDVKLTSSKGFIDNSYIFMIRYNTNYSKKVEHEDLYYVIPLDNSHVFIFNVTTTKGSKISESLLKVLKINSKEKYSKNIEKKYDGDYLVNELKILDYDKENYLSLKLFTPKEYEEIDYSTANNIYQYRYFGKNYNESKDSYGVKVKYYLSNLYDCNYSTDLISSNYKSYKNVVLSKITNQSYNGYNYQVYDVSYIYANKQEYEKRLRTKVGENKCFEVTINSNNKINENLNELTKFKTEKKKVDN